MDNEQIGKNQVLTLENRERFAVGAVENVESFSENEILLKTEFGGLCISGRNLRLEDFGAENGSIMLTGRVDSMVFSEIKEKRSFFRDMFR